MSGERFSPGAPLRGTVTPPPDKSISHRAALLAAMGEGRSEVRGYLDAADTRSTLAAVAALGADVSEAAGADPGGVDLAITGVGLRGARGAPAPVEIDVGNAGTLLRILPGWLAGQDGGEWSLDGDESIRRRPVDRVADPLRALGADVSCREGRLPPLRVSGAGPLRGGRAELELASAQVKSCLLLAGLLADGPLTVVEPGPSRDHTERMLVAAGASVSRESASSLPGRPLDRRRVTVEPAERIEPGRIEVPGDFSSAAFWIVAALIVPGSEVRVERVNLNPTRIGLLSILTRMGAAIEVIEGLAQGGEPIGTVVARSSRLEGTRVGAAEVPGAIDELPLLALAACFAEGETVLSGAEELRHKESDRIEAVCAGLGGIGAGIEAAPDGFIVSGGEGLRGGGIDARGDHRIAMLGAIAGLASADGVVVGGMGAARISYPGFAADLAALTRA